MLRAILGVIVGYIVTVVIIVAGFTVMQLALGTERVYQPASWEPSMLFCIGALVLGIIGAVIGGVVCGAISKSMTAVKVFAGLVLVFGIISAVMQMGLPDPGPRPAEVSPMESAQNARSPMWLNFANAFVGAAGIFIGGSMVLRKKPTP